MDTYKIPMLLRRHPHVPVAPLAQLAQLLHLVVRVLHVVLDGKTRRVVDAHVAPQAVEDAACFEGEQAGVGSYSETVSALS